MASSSASQPLATSSAWPTPSAPLAAGHADRQCGRQGHRSATSRARRTQPALPGACRPRRARRGGSRDHAPPHTPPVRCRQGGAPQREAQGGRSPQPLSPASPSHRLLPPGPHRAAAATRPPPSRGQRTQPRTSGAKARGRCRGPSPVPAGPSWRHRVATAQGRPRAATTRIAAASQHQFSPLAAAQPVPRATLLGAPARP